MDKTKKQIQYEINSMLKTIKSMQLRGENTKLLEEVVKGHQEALETPSNAQ